MRISNDWWRFAISGEDSLAKERRALHALDAIKNGNQLSESEH